MAKLKTDVQVHALGSQEFDDGLDVSVDLIDERLYLGNLECARDTKTTEKLGITHILTVDVVPLPRTVLQRPNIIFEYIKMADVPKEDLISHLPHAISFIQESIASGGTILVHCYFGVSRSAAVVIAFIMEKYQLCYDDAFLLVRTKRRFVSPNVGFAAQLRLFGHMRCRIDRDDPRYKQFRLKMAGQKLKEVKILPHLFLDLVKPDPGLARERPSPAVYRCRRCRRVVATQDNIIPHIPKQVKIELAKKGIRAPSSLLPSLLSHENGRLSTTLSELKNLARDVIETASSAETVTVTQKPTGTNETGAKSAGTDDTGTKVGAESDSSDSPGQSHSQKSDSDEGPSQGPDEYSEHLVDEHVTAASTAACRLMWFVEPMQWMAGVAQRASGKLHCPKCANKIGSFSWVMGCKCPCGQKVAPAFYLVPSKVEWSNIVQNVQITV